VRAYRAKTLTELHDRMCHKLVTSPAGELDVISTVDVQIHNVIAEASSMAWEFDLKDMWLTSSRWSMLVNQYIDPEALEAWIGQCTGRIGLKGRGIAVMRTKTVKPRGGEATGHTNKETRRWGSCMLAISYKAKPRPQITLYSRTSYLGYIGALDLSVAWMCARYLAKEMGIPVEQFSFVWMIEAIQWHNFKSLAYLLNNPNEDVRKYYRQMLMEPKRVLTPQQLGELEAAPGLELSRKWLQKVITEDAQGRTYGDLTYNTFRRIIRRYHTEVKGLQYAQAFEGWSFYKTGPRQGEQKEWFKAYEPLPSTRIETLDFSKLGMPLSRSYGEPFVGGNDDDDDDED
jgi:hypothetical protein